MAKILLVDDDLDLIGVVRDRLSFQHHNVETATTVQEAEDIIASSKFDAIVLDRTLPDGDGLDILKRHRTRGHKTPILLLTGKDALKEKTEGLDSGADDYLTKPFQIEELEARIRALLRRSSGGVMNILQVGDLVLDTEMYRVTKAGVDVQLLPKEFALLEFLMRHPSQVFSAEALLDRVWASQADVAPDTVRTCIKRLRRKIDGDSEESIIQTLHGVGYKLQAP